MAAALVLAAGCGSGSPAGSGSSGNVSAPSYLAAVCSAAAPVGQDFLHLGPAIVAMRTSNLPLFKRRFAATMTAMEVDARHAVTSLQKAGSPDVPEGKVIAGGLLHIFVVTDGALAQGRSEAETLPTTSQRAFGKALVSLVRDVQSTVLPVTAEGSTLMSPELKADENAVPACRSIGGL